MKQKLTKEEIEKFKEVMKKIKFSKPSKETKEMGYPKTKKESWGL